MSSCRVFIKGMHCRSCEMLVEDELLKVKGVEKATVNHMKAKAELQYSGPLDKNGIERAVKNAGYKLGVEKTRIFSNNPADYKDLGIAVFIAAVLYLAARQLGIFNLGGNTGSNPTGLGAVFIIGLTAGVSTCMALVGGLVLGAAANFAKKHPDSTGIQKFKPHLFFNAGRIAGYLIFGAIIGYLGSVFQLSVSILGLLTAAAGLAMLILGGQLIEILPFLKKVSFSLPAGIARKMGIQQQAETEYSHTNSAVMGAMTFFLPCGFTQAMQLFAMSTGNPIQGAMIMGVFALGTAPGLLGVGGMSAAVKGYAGKLFFKTAGVAVIMLAFFNLANGLNLLGINPVQGFSQRAAASSTDDPNVKLVSGMQEVRMNQLANGYSPNKFTIKKGIPVRWIINSKDSNTCASSILASKIGVRKTLTPGENIIDFLPEEAGTIRFTCSMGMYSGSFEVVGDQAIPTPAGTGETGNTKILKAVYTTSDDIDPNTFTVNEGDKARLEIEARDSGYGCMGSVTIPGLSDQVEVFEAGETLKLDFTADKPGRYPITCGMGIPRGVIEVI